MFITYLVLPFYWIRSIIITKFNLKDKIHSELKLYPKHYFGFRGIKVKVCGEQTPSDTPTIYLSNHQSMNDIFVSIAAVNKQFRFIAKKELFTNIVTGPFMKMSESYALDRDDARASLTLLKTAVSDLDAGHSILAFPEGTRSHQKDLLEFKDGIFAILRRASAPIVVMYIKESFNEKQKEIEVYFSKTIEADEYNKLKTKELSNLVFNNMQELMNEAYK